MPIASTSRTCKRKPNSARGSHLTSHLSDVVTGSSPAVTTASAVAAQRRCRGDSQEEHRSPGGIREDLLEQLGDRDALFALLSRILPWGQAANASAILINRYATLPEALAAPQEELALIEGVGTSIAGVLKVIHAAAIRLVAAPLKQGPILSRRPALEAYLSAAMAREPVEHCRVLFLDSAGCLILDEVVASGGPRGVTPDHSLIARRAVQVHASTVILVHNHPSGDPRPSVDDLETTHAIQKTLAVLGVSIHDHIVVARGGMTSMRSLGVLGC